MLGRVGDLSTALTIRSDGCSECSGGVFKADAVKQNNVCGWLSLSPYA